MAADQKVDKIDGYQLHSLRECPVCRENGVKSFLKPRKNHSEFCTGCGAVVSIQIPLSIPAAA